LVSASLALGLLGWAGTASASTYSPPGWYSEGTALILRLDPAANCDVVDDGEQFYGVPDPTCGLSNVPFQGKLLTAGCGASGLHENPPEQDRYSCDFEVLRGPGSPEFYCDRARDPERPEQEAAWVRSTGVTQPEDPRYPALADCLKIAPSPPQDHTKIDIACDVVLPFGGAAAGLASFLLDGTAAVASTSLGIGGAALAVGSMGCSLAKGKPDSPPFAEAACYGLGALSLGLEAGALYAAATIVGGEAALVLGGLSGATGIIDTIACAADPPRDDYYTLAVPKVGHVRVPARLKLTPTGVKLVRSLAVSGAKVAATGQAMVLCIDREAAAAAANDTVWVTRQQACAARYARALAKLVRAQLGLRKLAAKRLRVLHVHDRALSRGRVLDRLAHLPAADRRRLQRHHFSAAQIQAVGGARESVSSVGADGKTTLYQAIDGARAISTLRSAAHSFEQLADAQSAPPAG
jgi:hypothetical protein